MAASQSFGQQALEFIEELDRLDSPEVVVKVTYRLLGRLGFEGLFFAELDPRQPRRFDDFVPASRCPPEFGTIYTERNYASIDANIRRARRSSQTFEWSKAGYRDDDGEPRTWEIGEILSVAKRTVDEHAQTAMRKLGATSRTHAVAIALRNRLFEV